MAINSANTALILLGASEFPESDCFSGSSAFTTARDRVKTYFMGTAGLRRPGQILDLFDTDLDPGAIHRKLEGYLHDLPADISDVFFFYVGHGGYDTNSGFLFTIRQSRDAQLGVSSITARSLGKTFANLARDKRIYLLLDCCFAAEVCGAFFQGPIVDLISRQILSHFPGNGLALLCAASRDEPAIIVAERGTTMFSEGLDHALRFGSKTIDKEYLSLRDIGDLSYAYIRTLNPGKAVRPEVHTPIMPAGDIADKPLLKNAAWRGNRLAAAYNIETRKLDVEQSIMDNDVENTLKLFEGFVNDFDRQQAFRHEKVLIVSQFNTLEENKPHRGDRPAYQLYVADRQELYHRIMNVMNAIYPGSPGKDYWQLKDLFLGQQPDRRVILDGQHIHKKLSTAFSLQDISIKLELGEITGVIAENGHGKTSLLRILAGDLRADKGTIQYPQFGKRKRWVQIKESIGFVQQTITPWRGESVRERLQFTAAIKGITGKENQRQFEFIIARLGLERYKDNTWEQLSGGIRLRFEIARQLIWKPRLLVLDEPLANLDIRSQQLFLQDLRSLTDSISHSMAVIISSQNLYEIEKVTDHILYLRDGEVVYSGRTADVGRTNLFRCYEIGVNRDSTEIQQALVGLPVLEVRSDAFYTLIYTSQELRHGTILETLAGHGIEVWYFRDITHSTRLLFENA